MQHPKKNCAKYGRAHTLESAERELMPISVFVRVGIWLETAPIKEVMVEVMLILGLIQRVQQ